MHITLRAQERIYINGAVFRPDRKVSIELMNDAVFLLEAHIMHQQDATTPLRQWYYIVQLMLMERDEQPVNQTMFERHGAAMAAIYEDSAILAGLAKVAELVERKRLFEALKTTRALFPLEEAILTPAPALAQAS